MKVDQGLCFAVLVNPDAGLGGSVALKGSDGDQTRDEALRRGAEPQAPQRMSRALKVLPADAKVSVLTWGGEMGETSCRLAGLPCTVIDESSMPSTPEDTRTAAAALKAAGAELILFAGGDTDLYGYCLGNPVNFVDPEGTFVFAGSAAAIALVKAGIVTIGAMGAIIAGGWLHDALFNESSEGGDKACPLPDTKPGKKTKGKSELYEKDGDIENGFYLYLISTINT